MGRRASATLRTANSVRGQAHEGEWFWSGKRRHSAEEWLCGEGQKAVDWREELQCAQRQTMWLDLQCPSNYSPSERKKYNPVGQWFSTCGSPPLVKGVEFRVE